MHLLEFCAAAPFTCFYVCLILFSFLFCLQLFTCIPARCSKIYQQDFQRFLMKVKFFQNLINHQIAKQISPPFVEIVKKFSLSLRVLLSMKFGFKNLCRKDNIKQINQVANTQVSFSYFLIYFPDLLITFETYYPWSLDLRKWFASWW